jgi:hypothetical protein
MSPKKARKSALLLICCAIPAILQAGCDLFPRRCGLPSGDPVKEAEYPLAFTDEARKGKEFKVALFVSTAPGMGSEFARSEDILVANLIKKFPELAKGRNEKMEFIDPALVNKYETNSAYWYYRHPREWGKQLKADYVFKIQLDKMSLYQEGSQNRVYEGRAEVTVEVYDVAAGPVKPEYHYVYQFKYPYAGYLEASSIPVSTFKKNFLEHMGAEIAMKHVRHNESLEPSRAE